MMLKYLNGDELLKIAANLEKEGMAFYTKASENSRIADAKRPHHSATFLYQRSPRMPSRMLSLRKFKVSSSVVFSDGGGAVHRLTITIVAAQTNHVTVARVRNGCSQGTHFENTRSERTLKANPTAIAAVAPLPFALRHNIPNTKIAENGGAK